MACLLALYSVDQVLFINIVLLLNWFRYHQRSAGTFSSETIWFRYHQRSAGTFSSEAISDW